MGFRSLTLSLVLLVALIQSKDSLAEPTEWFQSFSSIGCKGKYIISEWAKVDRIIEDCYQLYREPEIYSKSRENCFANPFFKGCLDALMIEKEKVEDIKEYIKHFNGISI